MHNLNYIERIICYKKSRTVYIIIASIILLMLLLLFSTKVVGNDDGSYSYSGRFPFSIVVTSSTGLVLLPIGIFSMTLLLPVPVAQAVALREQRKLTQYIKTGDIKTFKTYWFKTQSPWFLKRYKQMIDCEIDFWEGSFHIAEKKAQGLLETYAQYPLEKYQKYYPELSYLADLIHCGLHKNLDHYTPTTLNEDSFLKDIEDLNNTHYTHNSLLYQETYSLLTDFNQFKEHYKDLNYTLYEHTLHIEKENRYGDERENY